MDRVHRLGQTRQVTGNPLIVRARLMSVLCSWPEEEECTSCFQVSPFLQACYHRQNVFFVMQPTIDIASLLLDGDEHAMVNSSRTPCDLSHPLTATKQRDHSQQKCERGAHRSGPGVV